MYAKITFSREHVKTAITVLYLAQWNRLQLFFGKYLVSHPTQAQPKPVNIHTFFMAQSKHKQNKNKNKHEFIGLEVKASHFVEYHISDHYIGNRMWCVLFVTMRPIAICCIVGKCAWVTFYVHVKLTKQNASHTEKTHTYSHSHKQINESMVVALFPFILVYRVKFSKYIFTSKMKNVTTKVANTPTRRCGTKEIGKVEQKKRRKNHVTEMRMKDLLFGLFKAFALNCMYKYTSRMFIQRFFDCFSVLLCTRIIRSQASVTTILLRY